MSEAQIFESPAEEEALEKAPPTAAEKREERQEATDLETTKAAEALAAMDDVGDSSLMPFSPQNFKDAWKLAHYLSLSGIVASGLKNNPGAVLSVMSRGAHLGIPWPVAVQEAHVIHGKVGWPAALLAAICDTSPTFEYFEVVEADNESATVEAKKPRWPKARRYTVTIEDAKDMGFMDKKHSELWTSKRPMPMLIAMARREAARLWDPARCAGVYTPDELLAAREEKHVGEAVEAEVVAEPRDRLLAAAQTVQANAAAAKAGSDDEKEDEWLTEGQLDAFRSRLSKTGLDDDEIANVIASISEDPNVIQITPAIARATLSTYREKARQKK